MILGIITAAICVLLLLKIISRKMGLKKLDDLLKKLHVPMGITAILVSIIHVFITFDVWNGREAIVYISGILATLMIFVMAAGYFFRKKIGSIWIKTHRAGAVITLILILSHIGSYYADFFAYKADISGIELQGVNISNYKNGTYQGEFDAGYIYAKVQVNVDNGKIADIRIVEHRNERGAGAERIADDIVKNQKTNVDAVSGATNSSRVIEKAVENAFLNK